MMAVASGRRCLTVISNGSRASFKCFRHETLEFRAYALNESKADRPATPS